MVGRVWALVVVVAAVPCGGCRPADTHQDGGGTGPPCTVLGATPAEVARCGDSGRRGPTSWGMGSDACYSTSNDSCGNCCDHRTPGCDACGGYWFSCSCSDSAVWWRCQQVNCDPFYHDAAMPVSDAGIDGLPDAAGEDGPEAAGADAGIDAPAADGAADGATDSAPDDAVDGGADSAPDGGTDSSPDGTVDGALAHDADPDVPGDSGVGSVGAVCLTGADCQSGLCLSGLTRDPAGTCTVPCDGGICPTGTACGPAGAPYCNQGSPSPLCRCPDGATVLINGVCTAGLWCL